jgi:hypothetical protein
MRNSSLLILEIIWWATGTVSVLAGIRFAVIEGGIKILLFIAMAIVSFLFAWLRHQQRKKS